MPHESYYNFGISVYSECYTKGHGCSFRGPGRFIKGQISVYLILLNIRVKNKNMNILKKVTNVLFFGWLTLFSAGIFTDFGLVIRMQSVTQGSAPRYLPWGQGPCEG